MKKIYQSRLPLSKNTCHFLKTKNLILWIQGKNILLSDPLIKQSKILYQHPKNVLSFDVNPQESLVATGEEGIQSDIYIYSLEQVK
jgi:hypothetical protein